MRGQQTILSTILISGIVIAIVTTAFAWGKPLIDKSTDKTKIDNYILKFEEIDSAVKSVASTGSSKTINVELHTDDELQITTNGTLKLATKLKIPIIGSKDFAPLNSYDLFQERELILVNTTETVGDECSQWTGGLAWTYTDDIHKGIAEFGGVNQTVLVYKRSDCPAYCYSCIVDNCTKPTASNCAKIDETTQVNNVGYTLKSLVSSGNTILYIGEMIENIGLISRDVAGIISGKSDMLGVKEGLITTIRLDYRGLMDDKGIIHRVIISCAGECIRSNGKQQLKIQRSEIKRNPGSIDTYVTIQFV